MATQSCSSAPCTLQSSTLLGDSCLLQGAQQSNTESNQTKQGKGSRGVKGRQPSQFAGSKGMIGRLTLHIESKVVHGCYIKSTRSFVWNQSRDIRANSCHETKMLIRVIKVQS